ncbi:hypothetical protein [Streptomyces macrosporus]|uniref:FG-GAP repeat protein n=1 Tax=Streptomyces macrosporus TaxID=44032 RepID=A0ABN3KHM1_9ACTN
MREEHGRRTARRVAALLVVGVVGLVGLPGTATAWPLTAPADIDGDGYRDVVLPAPGATVAGEQSAGVVVVLYGSSTGVSAERRVVVTQNSAGVPGGAEAGDRFGFSTALADLDRDGYADLVVGTPGEDLGTARDAGMVSVLWGGTSGLSGGANLPTSTETGWGAGQDVAAASDPTGAQVLIANYNFATHLTGPFTRSGGVGGSVLHDEVGWMGTVALGDLNNDKTADRVIVTGRAGGHSGGLVHVDSDPGDLGRTRSAVDGLSAAVGDVNGDGYGDLVVGDPDEPTAEGPVGHLGGAVHVWFGSIGGVDHDASPTTIHQDTTEVPGVGERYDYFGAAVAVADLDQDGVGDIVVGVPGEALGSIGGAGSVVVVPGRRAGRLGQGAYGFSQDTAGVPGGSEAGDFFGNTVGAGDLDRDGRPELLVGAAGENDLQGAAWVIPGGTTRPLYSSGLMFTTSALGLPAQSGTRLGGDTLW